MDFRIFFQLREKRFWWLDVIFYFAVSLFIATLLCYFIFLIKNVVQKEEIKYQDAALQTVGTEEQREQEKEVINYQKKISDFTKLLEGHEFASNAFAFMENETMPEIWFKQFSLDGRAKEIRLIGESDDMESFSRQVGSLEKNEYVKSVGNLTSTLGQSARVQFSFSLTLDPKIFNYIPPPPSEEAEQPEKVESQPLESQKMITVFDLLLNPETVGIIDQTNHAIKLDVPYGTDLTNLQTFIVVSPGAAVEPASGVAQDFSKPVLYKVTAKDGSIQNYTVAASILPQGGAEGAEGKPGAVKIWLVIILILIVIAAISGIVFLAFRKLKKKKENAN